jgi:hypothetical protein
MELSSLGGELEPVGPVVWLGCLAFVFAARYVLNRVGYWPRHRKLMHFGAVVLLTPLVYVGHPAIFAPLWIYAFSSVTAFLMALAAWSLVYFISMGVVRYFRKKES